MYKRIYLSKNYVNIHSWALQEKTAVAVPKASSQFLCLTQAFKSSNILITLNSKTHISSLHTLLSTVRQSREPMPCNGEQPIQDTHIHKDRLINRYRENNVPIMFNHCWWYYSYIKDDNSYINYYLLNLHYTWYCMLGTSHILSNLDIGKSRTAISITI